MFKQIVKLAAIVFVLVAGYKGAQIYATLKLADHLNACTSTEKLCRLVRQKAPATEIGATMRDVFACVKQKQSWIETRLLPLDKPLSDPAPRSVDYAAAAGLCK